MAKAKSSDFDAEHARIMQEYDEALAVTRGDNAPTPGAKRRSDRAQEALFLHRQELRRVGQFFGDRPVDPTGEIDNDLVLGVKTVDNTDEVPTL